MIPVDLSFPASDHLGEQRESHPAVLMSGPDHSLIVHCITYFFILALNVGVICYKTIVTGAIKTSMKALILHFKLKL